MKIFAIIVLSFFCFTLQANPFASKSPVPVVKKKPQKQKKKEKFKTINSDIYFLGKIVAGNNYFGILVAQDNQYLLQINEKLLDFEVIKIEDEYILLRKEKETYRIEVYN